MGLGCGGCVRVSHLSPYQPSLHTHAFLVTSISPPRYLAAQFPFTHPAAPHVSMAMYYHINIYKNNKKSQIVRRV